VRPHDRPDSVRLVALALSVYPTWWKQRYGQDTATTCDDLVAEGRRPARLAFGLAVGALDARLFGAGLPPVPSLYRRWAKAALMVETLLVLVVVPMLIWIAGSTGDRAGGVGGHYIRTAHGVREYSTQFVPLSAGGSLARYCAASIFLLLVPATLGILAGAWGSVRPELFRRRMAWSALWFAPAVSAVASLGLGILHGLASRGQIGTVTNGGPHPLLATVLGIAALSALGLVFASMVAIAVVVARIELPLETLKLGVKVGWRLSVVTVLAAFAVIGWAIGLGLQTPLNTHLSYNVTHSALAPWSVVLAAGMAVVAVLAVTGSVQARRCWRTAGRLAQIEH